MKPKPENYFRLPHNAYAPKMYAGKWQGTMALTETEAGSSLADITTAAEATDQGYYLIKVSQKDPTLPQIPIIEHADVKRMLLFQRAVTEGSLSLIMQCSKYVDLQKVLSGADKEKYHLLLEILTPIAKSYP